MKIKLTHFQTGLAISVGIISLITGIYTLKKNILSEYGDLNGIVTSVNQPIEGVKIDILDKNQAIISSLVTDNNGKFYQEHLKEGFYSLRISSNNFEPQLQSVVIDNKDTTNIQIDLKPLRQEKSEIFKALDKKAAELIKSFGVEKSPVE